MFNAAGACRQRRPVPEGGLHCSAEGTEGEFSVLSLVDVLSFGDLDPERALKANIVSVQNMHFCGVSFRPVTIVT